ncbi:hypothetical protein NDU88_006360 [Pleurodeles waltl]|uniref:Uncharacterized protein n=1 Tax=Pleurodeles waltl TaxID=8319 RepID=A0AAV7MYZ9_PLEWA|nr:hypothetical protein NDU88_006360 [Pleurodeles waltl]
MCPTAHSDDLASVVVSDVSPSSHLPHSEVRTDVVASSDRTPDRGELTCPGRKFQAIQMGGIPSRWGGVSPPGLPDQKEGEIAVPLSPCGGIRYLGASQRFCAQYRVQLAMPGPNQDGREVPRRPRPLPADHTVLRHDSPTRPLPHSYAGSEVPTSSLPEGSVALMCSSHLRRRQVPSCASRVLAAILHRLTLLRLPSPAASVFSGTGAPGCSEYCSGRTPRSTVERHTARAQLPGPG